MPIKQKKLTNYEKLRQIDPDRPQPELIRETARIIHKGGVVAFPTRCLYGLGANALSAQAVDKIFKIKQRPYDKPLLILINRRQDLTDWVKDIPPLAEHLMNSFWPGRLTIVFEAKITLPAELTAGTGKIGIRLPGHKVAAALVDAVGGPITGTSANLSGEAGYTRCTELHSSIADKLDLILDAGPLKGGRGSTVIDTTTDTPLILREGEVTAKEINRVLASHI
ncbi:L-threonylcarbamoyladenylate synthase [Thermodesulfobacteriota bacterium]